VPKRTRREEKDDARVRAFGERLRQLRAEQKLTQEGLAHAAGVTAAEVGFIERAEREPGLIMVLRLAKGLGVGAEVLMRDLDRPLTQETAIDERAKPSHEPPGTSCPTRMQGN
jgi:transcriptional regulator with XRE-family HTH domain